MSSHYVIPLNYVLLDLAGQKYMFYVLCSLLYVLWFMFYVLSLTWALQPAIQNFLLSGKSGRQGKGALRPGVPTYVSCAAGFYPKYPQVGIIRVSSPTQCMDGKLELVRNSLYSCFRGNCQSFSRKCREYVKFHFLRIFWFGEIFANVFSY